MKQKTLPVSDAVFRQVYDSPASLPGRHRWVTNDADVREIEKVLGMPARTIGAPLWVSGDRKDCPKCGRETNWLDIILSGLARVHSSEMIAGGHPRRPEIRQRRGSARHRRPQVRVVQDSDQDHPELQMPQLGVCQAGHAGDLQADDGPVRRSGGLGPRIAMAVIATAARALSARTIMCRPFGTKKRSHLSIVFGRFSCANQLNVSVAGC